MINRDNIFEENAPHPPLVSVALITYNHGEFLAECLDSILSQSYGKLEIIVADDCSSDKTQSILKKYSQLNPQLRLFLAKENAGVTINHNVALRNCRGKYISWMSGDDIMLPGKISKQVELLESDPNCSICYHDLKIFSTYDREETYLRSSIDKPREGGIASAIRYGCFNGGVSNMVRKSAVPSEGFDERIPIASDWLFWVETLRGGGTIRFIDEVLALHRRHESNVTTGDPRSPSLREIQDHLNSSEIILSEFPEHRANVKYRKSTLYSSLRWLGQGEKYYKYLALSLFERPRLRVLGGLILFIIFKIRR